MAVRAGEKLRPRPSPRTSAPSLLALLLVVGCGGAPAATSTVAQPEALSARPATDYLLPQTMALARVDVAALRALPVYDSAWRALEAHGAARERATFETLRALVDATDTLWVGADLPRRRLPHMVVVARGHYPEALIVRGAAALGVWDWRPAAAARDRPVLTSRDGVVVAPDDETVVFGIGVSEARLRALVEGAPRPIGALDGLLALGEGRGFGHHTLDVVGLPAGRALRSRTHGPPRPRHEIRAGVFLSGSHRRPVGKLRCCLRRCCAFAHVTRDAARHRPVSFRPTSGRRTC